MTERAQPASIDVPEIGMIPALVEFHSARATAVLLVRPLRSLKGAIGAPVRIDIATSRGLLHVDARLAGVEGEVLELDIAEREVIQRRGYARVDAYLEVTIEPSDGGEPIPAAAVNISGSGAVVSHLEALAPGDAVALSLHLAPHDPPVQISGRVVRAHDERLRAVHFEAVAEADRERIVRFVFDRQRRELARVKHA